MLRRFCQGRRSRRTAIARLPRVIARDTAHEIQIPDFAADQGQSYQTLLHLDMRAVTSSRQRPEIAGTLNKIAVWIADGKAGHLSYFTTETLTLRCNA